MKRLVIASLLLGVTSAYAAAPVTVPLNSPQGQALGTVTATAAPNGVLFRIEAKGLPPGWHGVHLHQKGLCDDPKLESAGGHIHGGAASKHGLLNADRTDFDDLTNVYVAADGTLNADLYTTEVRLKAGTDTTPALLDADGSALIVHASPDDYQSQPIGNSGARIACAVMK